MMRMLGPVVVVVVVGGRMMRMLGSGLPAAFGGMRGVGRLLPCRLFWLAGGLGRVRLLSVSLAWGGLEVVGLGGHGVGRKGVWPAAPDPLAGALPAFAWSLLRGCA